MLEQEILEELRGLNRRIDRLASSLEAFISEDRIKKTVKAHKPKPAPITAEEMEQHQSTFDQLYQKWLSGDELGVHGQLDKLDAEELRRFGDSNNLNVTSKMSKDRVLQLISARFREKKQLHQTSPSQTP